nr:YigZ family protein [bacterium]
MPEYRIPAREGHSEFFIKQSRFYGSATYCPDEKAFEAFMAEVRARYPEASAHAFAYCMGRSRDIRRFSDGGEPGGTAGLPMFEVIDKRGLTDTAVIVTRYFGGIHLGAGGLVRAFSHTCALALEDAGVSVLVAAKVYAVAVDYPTLGRVQHYLEHAPHILLDTSFAADVTLFIRVYAQEEAGFLQDMSQLTLGRAQPEVLEEGFYPRPVPAEPGNLPNNR